MRESIGAGYIFTICVVFIMLFTAFLAVSVNYAKAFKINNHIVEELEENKELTDDVETEITTYLTSQGYGAYGDCESYQSNRYKGDDEELSSKWIPAGNIRYSGPDDKNNICIFKLDVDENQANDDLGKGGYYYKVVTFFKFELPIIDTVLTFPVSGDSKYIVNSTNSEI